MKHIRRWYFNMPSKVKEILDLLIEKSETKPCVDKNKVIEIKKRLNWTNLPIIIKDSLKLININITNKDYSLFPNWRDLPNMIEILEHNVNNLDCRDMNISKESVEEIHISSIKLTEYNEEENLSGDNEKVNFIVYFKDESGDETPNIGEKLFIDKEMLKPFSNHKGAFYFIRPSEPSKKSIIKVRGTGTVKKIEK